MKVSVNWLRELVDIDMEVEALAHALTMGGLEVEEITPVAAAFSGVVVGHVKSVTAHPNADKLRVTEVDAGTGETLTIVCGAPNVAAGQRVACALVGAKLGDMEIRKAKLRGVESSGMLCSARELGRRRITRVCWCWKRKHPWAATCAPCSISMMRISR
jgi:phenylalanyl-tRNA synthetase beta chain